MNENLKFYLKIIVFGVIACIIVVIISAIFLNIYERKYEPKCYNIPKIITIDDNKYEFVVIENNYAKYASGDVIMFQKLKEVDCGYKN